VFKRHFDAAVAKLLVAIHERPTNPPPYRSLACCYAHMGRLDEAKEIVARLRSITGAIIPGTLHFRNQEHRELFLSGLRLAIGEAT
jgi:adenylate cyclase